MHEYLKNVYCKSNSLNGKAFKAHLLIPGFMVSNILKFVIIGFIIIIKMPTLNLKLTLITDYNY